MARNTGRQDLDIAGNLPVLPTEESDKPCYTTTGALCPTENEGGCHDSGVAHLLFRKASLSELG